MRTLLAILVIASCTCVPGAFAQGNNEQISNCGPENIKFSIDTDTNQHPLPKPETGKALVYVFEWGPSARSRIAVDGAWVGANDDGSYLFFSVSPGEHHLCADWQALFHGRHVALNSFTAEAGKVYYFKSHAYLLSEERTWTVSDFQLEPVNNDEAVWVLHDLPYSDSHPAKKWATRSRSSEGDPVDDR